MLLKYLIYGNQVPVCEDIGCILIRMDTPKTLKGGCESCMMPFNKDPRGERREHEKYCSYCYRDGKLCYEGTDVREFKKAMIKAITDRGEGRLKAHVYAFIAGFAPRWRT